MDTRVGKGFVAIMLVVMMLSVSAIIVGTSPASALTEGSYTYTVTGSEATITGYTGTDAVLSIPSTLGGTTVTAIANNVFQSRNALTSVTIPSGISSIGKNAFDSINLATIIVDGSNANFASSSGVLYSHDLTTLIKYPQAKTGDSFMIPDGVTTLTDNAFSSCNYLRSLTIPSALSSVGNDKFILSSLLTSFTVDVNSPYYSSSGGVLYDKFATTLVCYANGLTAASFTIPSTVTSIASNAFYNCRATSVTIPEGVRSIGEYAFCQSALTSVTIPDSLTYMGNFSFYNSNSVTSVHIGTGLTYVSNYSFTACAHLATVSIGSNVQNIGTSAFGQCGQLTSFNIPSKVKTIGNGAFWQSHVTSVIIPDGVRSIGNYAFKNCVLLQSIAIPDSVTSMGNETFSGCTALASATIGSGAKYVGLEAFKSCPALTYVSIGRNVTWIGNSAFASDVLLASVTIPANVTTIGNNVFLGCSSLTSITFTGMVVPTLVGTNWVASTNAGIRGHAYEVSNFPAPGNYFWTLLMGGVVPVVPGVPTGLTAVAGFEQVTLTWTAPTLTSGYTIDYYIVNQDGAGTGAHIAGTTTTITGLNNSQTYSYTVQAHTTIGTGAASAPAIGVPSDVPGVPTGLTAVPGNDFVTLSWTAPAFHGSAVDYYTVSQNGSALPTHYTGLTATITGLTPGVGYSFAVSAHNLGGNGMATNAVATTMGIYITVDAAPSAQYVNAMTASVLTINVSVRSSLPSITLASANVSHYVDGVLVGNTVISVSGTSYSSTMSLLPSAGINVWTFTFNDSVGNSVMKSVTVIYDNTDPTISVVSPSNGAFNNTGAVAVAWTANGGLSGLAYFELRVDAGVILTLPSDVLSLDLNNLDDGNYTVSVVAYDNAGNHKQALVNFTVDTVDPNVSIVSPVNGSYNNGNLTIVWASNDALSGVAYHEIRIDNDVILTLPADVLSLPYTGLSRGNHSLTVTAYDNAGNHKVAATSFVVSTTGPIITCTPASPIYTNSHSIEVHVSMRSTVPMTTANVSMYSNGVLMEHYAIYGMAGESSSGYFALLYPESGVNHYRVTVNDSAGNSATLDVTIYRDATPPTVRIITPSNHAFNNTGSMALSWSATDSIGIDRFEIFVNGGKVATLGAGNSTYALPLPEGNDEISIYVYDLAGNSAHATIYVIVDLTGPIVAITSPAEGGRTLSTMTFTWLGANPLSGIARYVISIDGGEGIELSAATHSHDFTALASGQHTVMVKAFDNTGNSASHSVTFTVDTVGPAITSATPTGENVSINAAIVIAFSEAMDHVSTTIRIAGVNGTMTWSGNTATFTPSSALAYGTAYTVTVSGLDLAGNSVTSTESFTTVIGYSVVSGVIKDAGGNVIADAEVTLSNGMTAMTDANGTFSFSNVSAGTYNLTVSKTGYETITQSVSATAGETTALGTLSVGTAGATPNNDNSILVIAAVVAIVALLFVLILFMRRRKKKV